MSKQERPNLMYFISIVWFSPHILIFSRMLIIHVINIIFTLQLWVTCFGGEMQKGFLQGLCRTLKTLKTLNFEIRLANHENRENPSFSKEKPWKNKYFVTPKKLFIFSWWPQSWKVLECPGIFMKMSSVLECPGFFLH